jgi:hypothetical protein
MALVGSDDMARCAPPHRYPLAIGGIGGEGGPRHDRGMNSKSSSKKYCTLIDSSGDRRQIDHTPGS